MKKYIPSEIEPKWQRKWQEDKLFSLDLEKAAKPYYSLMMFPYPSAEGLHVGNMYAFTGSDIYSRFKRMQGLDVFEPIGLDGFGIHSENYALKVNEHPMELSKKTEKRFYEQLHIIGNSFDWIRTVETYKPNYYQWTQWLFLQMYKKGLAYRKKASVNWCPKDKTVLADEQVINGACERCASKVEQKLLEQWFFKITDYADRLLSNLDKLDWSEKVKIAQRIWIGKSEGVILKFDSLDVFTTRHDTIFGATFIVISPEHPLLIKLTSEEQRKQVEDYIEVSKKKTEEEKKQSKEKTGIFTGSYVKNPFTKKDIPVWVADYVLMGYGTGVVMGVPANDERDFEFAKKYGLEIQPVVSVESKPTNEGYEGEGILVNSGEFDGLDTKTGREKIANYIEEHHLGQRKIKWHLRDWLISRQRYWGPPIPIIYCDKCGIVPVPEEALPVELPFVEEFRPSGTGQSPLASVPAFYNVKCPKCGDQARRETDVSDTFLDSAWYFLRYPSTEFEDKAFDSSRTKKWLPVNMYIGGAEHSVLHLLYSRFITMVLHDLGLINFEEPFTTFRAHGLIIAEGAKMSKSKGNIVNPDNYIKEYGADTLRAYLMFIGPFSEGGDFRDSSLHGIYRFLQRVWGFAEKVTGDRVQVTDEDLRIMHKTIKKVTVDIGGLKYNTAIASLMEWLNHLSRRESISKDEYKTFLLLLAPFAPHITEELWSVLGQKYSIHKHSFPEFDNKYLTDREFLLVVQVNGKVRDTLLIEKDLLSNKERIENLAKNLPKIQKFLEVSAVKKSFYIPGKVINFVV